MTREFIPSVLVEHGKHGDFYWNANTQEDFQRSAFAILKDRHEQGYYYYDPGDTPPKYEGLPLDAIKALKEKDEDLYKTAGRKYNRWLREKRQWEDDKAFYRGVVACIENDLVGNAWSLLDQHNDYEHERVELERLQTYDI